MEGRIWFCINQMGIAKFLSPQEKEHRYSRVDLETEQLRES